MKVCGRPEPYIHIIHIWDFHKILEPDYRDWCPLQLQQHWLDWELMMQNNLFRSALISKVLDEISHFCLGLPGYVHFHVES